MTLIAKSTDTIYGPTIELFMAAQLPSVQLPKGQMLDAVTEALLSTSQHRLGPRPSPENLVEIRRVVTAAITEGRRVPIFVAWGSRKPNNVAGPDIAEVMGLRMLECLNDRVKRFYPAGVEVNIGLEDLGGQFTRQGERQEIIDGIPKYADAMVKLTDVLGLSSWVKTIPESTLVTRGEFFAKANVVSGALVDALWQFAATRTVEVEQQAALAEVGWKGGLNEESVNYYLGRYAKLYPEMSIAGRISKLSRYWGAASARYQVGAKVANKEWLDPQHGYINLSFVEPIPGMPSELANRRLYYRTVPVSYTKNHLPAWRSKGYLRISENGDVAPKLANAGEVLSLDLHRNTITLTKDGSESVEVQADYTLG